MMKETSLAAEKDMLLSAMRLGIENAKTYEDKFLASKNLLQMELAFSHVDGERDLSDEEWIIRYGGFLSMVIDSNKSFQDKMMAGTLSREEKEEIISRAHEMYLESLN